MSKRKAVAQLLEHFRGVLRYKPRTGDFIWLVERNSHGGKIKPGDVAGTPAIDRDGSVHISIGIDGKVYRAHRLAWLFMTGKWPKADIDHRDGTRTNNRWKNLGDKSRGHNNANRHKLSVSNKSGKAGVSWVANRNQWLSRINVDGKPIHLGMFDRGKLDEAISIRRAAELKYWGEHATTENVVVEISARRLRALPNERPAPKLDGRSKSGKTGVSWTTRNDKWRVTIRIDGKHVHVGDFPPDQLKKAIEARRAAELKHYGAYSPK